MPVPLSPQAQSMMQDPYGQAFAGAPDWVSSIARFLLPNPQIPYAFGSVVSPRGSLTSIVPKGEEITEAPAAAMLREQLQRIAGSPVAREGQPRAALSTRRAAATQGGMDTKRLRDMIDAWMDWGAYGRAGRGADTPVGARTFIPEGSQGPSQLTRQAPEYSMSYPSQGEIDSFLRLMGYIYHGLGG